MSEIVVGSWVRESGPLAAMKSSQIGRVIDTQRQTGEPVELDEVRYVVDGVKYTTVRGALELVDAPDAEVDALATDDEPCVRREDALTQEITRLKDEVAGLETEMDRRDRVAREKYEALERDRDYVESAMREASRRADDAERNLKVVLEREEARIKAVKDRADMWQAAAADALAQLKALREAKG